MRLELVKDWMTREVLVVAPETTLMEAGRAMVDHKIRRLPVVEDGRLTGIVTRGDIQGARASAAGVDLDVWELSHAISRLNVGEIMTPNPVTIAPNKTIGEAAQLMLKHKIGGLPVLDHLGRLVGILTESDIFRLVAHDWLRSQDEPSEPFAHYE